MIILEKPYVSKFLEETLEENKYPVLKNDVVHEFNLSSSLNYWDTDYAISQIKQGNDKLVLSNSENSINWVVNNLKFTDLPEKISLFKDKYKFRQVISSLYPDFFFKEVDFADLDKLDVISIKKPFIIKPTVGFFSMGVHKVISNLDWENVLSSIKLEIEKVKDLYPEEVMNSSKFIIEENIEGDEFAVDVYYTNDGTPVVLNILHHIFGSEKDVSDRVYITSKEIIEKHLGDFTDLMEKIGKLADIKNFPMHIEVRVDNNNRIVPIEVNPMRFAGWCTTDLAFFAYGLNVYKHYFEQIKPDWNRLLADKAGKIYSFVIADIPQDINRNNIAEVDYDSFLKCFKKPLEFRKVDFHKYPVFGYGFMESDDYNEIENILKADFRKFIKLK